MKERQRWQPEEDALLRSYVKQYGPKEWNLLSQRMSKPLDRDAKSCLERWKNYLKPGIKKGSLSEQEQTLVISLQAKYGNKWKKIASEVPGRTAKRLGKWWEVFKEKQLKEKRRNQEHLHPLDSATDSSSSPFSEDIKSTTASKYDHILETFAEKYVHVQPKLNKEVVVLPSLPLLMPNLSPPPPLLSLGVNEAVPPSNSSLPPWMSNNSSSSSSTTASPSVSLSLSPSEPAVLETGSSELGLNRFTLVQCCKELEEGRQNWAQHKKEATWRLSRLEQQLESEKARKRREKMEEVEAKIRCLREEEMAYLDRIEAECREQLSAIQRDADAKEAKMVEMWAAKHLKLAKFVEQMGLHHHFSVAKDLH